MDQTDLPADWEAQVVRAYATFSNDPLDGMDEFGIWGKLDPDFLSEKAKRQLRDLKGRFREMRARIYDKTQQRHATGYGDWLSPPTVRPKGPPPFKVHPGHAPPLPASQVRSYSGAKARDVLYRAGFNGREADNYAWTGTVHTADGKNFAWTPNVGFVHAGLRKLFGDNYEGTDEEIDRIIRATPNAATDARYALARMQDLQKMAPGLMDKKKPFMIEFDDIALARLGAYGVVNSLGPRNYLKLRTELYGRTMGQKMLEDRDEPEEPSNWESGREWAANIDAVQYILAHELGHTKDKRALTPGHSRGPLNLMWWMNNRGRRGTTAYGNSNAAEGYAEAFARYIMMARSGQHIPDVVQEYADKFGWSKFLRGRK